MTKEVIREELPPEEYPYEPECDRWYRKHIVPLFEKQALITKMYWGMRLKCQLKKR